ncbi:50S ribosomal protein L2 [Candidatus Uhrbacteria bacterium]|nr:50S ribosomal protein L2 [Candidatus Uhrbacteria bacterium]
MPVKYYKPTTSGRRHASVADTSELSRSRPPKRLRFSQKRSGGRNAQGKITVRHRGGGADRFVRVVDFMREKYDMPARVVTIEYDPGRGAHIALVRYRDGEQRYIIAPLELNIGDEVVSSKSNVPVKNGNRMPLMNIPIGLTVHALEFYPGSGAKLVRGAGAGAQLLALEGDYAHIKLPSGEIRMLLKASAATIGIVGNSDHNLIRLGKAGRTRHLGFKPTVRGKAMNPVDHPHGGGEGHNPIGLSHPKTPWGKHALGVKTRAANKWSDALIIKRRK